MVSSDEWHIHYYFSGPDYRYSGTFVDIDGSEVKEYISTWKNNFEKYMKLKNIIPLDGQFETAGVAGMSIRIGFVEGVCLRSYHMPINSLDKLNQVICDYENAENRAYKIQELLKTI